MIKKINATQQPYLVVAFLIILVGLLLIIPVQSALAQGSMATDEGLEITGLLMDQTKTKAGRDFFESFAKSWQEVKGLSYTITIVERPDSTRGSFITVLVNDDRVYFSRTNPRMDWIEQAAKQAAQQVSIYLFRKMSTQKLLEEEFQY